MILYSLFLYLIEQIDLGLGHTAVANGFANANFGLDVVIWELARGLAMRKWRMYRSE